MRFSRFTLLYFFYSLFSTGTAFGSHIIGGDLSLQWISDYNYQLSFYFYFDILDANPETEDATINVEVYRKSDNTLAEFYTIPQLSVENITYANPHCSSAAWQMQLFTYSLVIQLSPTQFNDPQGYYVVWERCCRNKAINIQDPLNCGAAFTLEFPATSLMRDSSPAFKKNKGDFACVGHTFTMDYSATDADNDSLSYQIVTPTKGHATATQAEILPLPAPYPNAVWQDPYSLQKPTVGSVPFQINNKTGLIQFNSQNPGLFLFAVECTEYRNGVPIGKVYHDFEVFIIDCPSHSPPKLSVINGNDTLSRLNTVLQYGQKGCYPLLIQDQEVFSTYSLTLTPSNNNFQLAGITQSILNPTNSTSSICITGCTKDVQGNYSIVVGDQQGCPTEYDTLPVQISIYPPSIPTIYTIPDAGSLQLPVSDTYHLQVIGFSPDTSDYITLLTTQNQKTIELLQYTDNGTTYTSSNSAQDLISLTPTCDGINQPAQKLYFNVATQRCTGYYTESIVVNVTTIENDSLDVNKIPNIFTPNGDKINDTFPIILLQNKSCDNQFVAFNVFNRWGGQVHRSTNLAEEWDGNNLPDGMYFYEAEYEKQTVKGYLQILR